MSRPYIPAGDRPRFHRLDLSARVQRGSGGRPFAKTGPNYRDPPDAECKPYGGPCLGDGCVNWFPLPSPARCQEATCGLSRDNKPIHLKEAKRKLRQAIALGEECRRLGWLGSAQVAFQRAWAWAFTVAEIEEAA